VILNQLWVITDIQFFIKFQVFQVREDIINFWLPFGLPWVPVLIWLRPRIKLLNLRRKKGDSYFGYQFVVALAIAVPTIIAQTYIETASGKLTALQNVKQIENEEPTKFYTIKNFYIDKRHIGVYSSFETSGRYNEHFDMNLYVALPILENPSDTLNSICMGWLGIQYHDQISNRLEPNEKEVEYKRFAAESQKDFYKKNVNEFVYLSRVGNSGVGQGFKEAIKQDLKFNSLHSNLFLPVNEPFESRNGSTFGWIFGSFAIGAGLLLIMLIFPKFDDENVVKFESGKKSNNKEFQEFIEFLKPKEGYFSTPIIIYLNVIVFAGMVLAGFGFNSFKGQDLLSLGANFRPLNNKRRMVEAFN
jgi:rhomboid protease GluP